MSKVQNKPNLRQFVVVNQYYDHEERKWKEEHIFTTDSFKEAVKIAYESMSEDRFILLYI